MKITPPRWRLGLLLTLAGLAMAGCVTTAPKATTMATEPASVFYPPLPNAPRIQYLTSISSEKDLASERDEFADFILGEEREEHRLAQPYGIAMRDGKVFVADTGAGGIAVFDLRQKKFQFMTGSGGGRMKRPINIRIDTDGTRYITDTGRDQVLVYDAQDRFVAAYGQEGQFRPVDVAIGRDRLYVADILHHQIHVLDKSSGKKLFVFGRAGSGDGELFHPTNLALAPDGDLYVVETGNFRVQRFTAEGKQVKTLGGVGASLGSFARPKGIAIDRGGRMYVGDAAFQNVQMFDAGGKLLMFFGQSENPAEALNLPAGVTIDYDNVKSFSRYAKQGFAVEYLILVASQFGPNKIDVFGFGQLPGKEYPADTKPVTAAAS